VTNDVGDAAWRGKPPLCDLHHGEDVASLSLNQAALPAGLVGLVVVRGRRAACGVRRAWLAAGPFRSACASGCRRSPWALLVSNQ